MRIEACETLTEAQRQGVTDLLAELSGRRSIGIEHDPRWPDVLARGLGHRPVWLIARKPRSSTLEGVMALARVRSRLFGRYLVSLPYVSRAGALALDGVTAAALERRAIELGRRWAVRYVELRGEIEADDGGAPAWDRQRTDKARMERALPGDDASLWAALSAKVRNQVRKGASRGLSIRWGGRETLDGFYRVFAVNMRDLGTPVYPRRFFEAVLEGFAGEAECAVVEHEGRPVAGAVLLHGHAPWQSGATSLVPSAASLRDQPQLNANMWMYHELLRRAVALGSVTFDFGRSTVGSGPYRFKKQWGAEPRPLRWVYRMSEPASSVLRADDPAMARRVAAWRRLPVWVTRLIGPPIVRGIP